MIDSRRLSLRRLKLTDKEEIYHYRSDVEANKYQSWVPKTIEEVESFIRANPKEFNVCNTWFQLGIIEKASNRIIGDVGVHFKDDHQIELGITLSKQEQRKGFATESMIAIISHLFLDLDKHRIVTSVDPRNTSSLMLMKRLGLRKEGYFRESIYFKDEWVDDVVYAVLKKEWIEKSRDLITD